MKTPKLVDILRNNQWICFGPLRYNVKLIYISQELTIQLEWLVDYEEKRQIYLIILWKTIRQPKSLSGQCSPSPLPLFTIAAAVHHSVAAVHRSIAAVHHRRCSSAAVHHLAAAPLLFTIASPLLLAIPECQPRSSATFDLFKISRTHPLIHKFGIVHNYYYTDLGARW